MRGKKITIHLGPALPKVSERRQSGLIFMKHVVAQHFFLNACTKSYPNVKMENVKAR